MDSIFIGIIALIIGAILFILITKNKSNNEPAELTYNPPPAQTPVNNPQQECINNRQFTLAELKRAEAGKYSWDETGCVFEINSDGSVTVVGRFDPAELHVNPVQELYDSLIDAGLSDMLPSVCCFHAFNYTGGETDSFVAAYNDEILSIPSCPNSINGINEVAFSHSSFDSAGKAVILFNLSKIREGILILMPSNEKEYIFSLGAKACVDRAFGNKIIVRISSPAVMGAFGIAIAREIGKSSKISFAFGDGEDYMCCNMLVEDGICEVQNILRRSIIQPTENIIILQHIAKGCMVQSLIIQGQIKDYMLQDMFPYTMSFLLKENGRVIKIYDCISEPISIPTRRGDKDINVDANKTLSFLIGSNELIDDVMAEYDIPNGNIGAFIELDANMDVNIKISSTSNQYRINVGELIG